MLRRILTGSAEYEGVGESLFVAAYVPLRGVPKEGPGGPREAPEAPWRPLGGVIEPWKPLGGALVAPTWLTDGSWGALGGLLELSWAVLEASWTP